MLFHLSNFGFGLGSKTDILNTGAKAPTLAEWAPC